MPAYNAIDLFCGCGGMTEGLKQAGFKVIAGIEIDEHAAKTYRLNHERDGTVLFKQDIRSIDTNAIKELLRGEPLHLLAGCPPCQGFSTLKRKNKRRSARDPRNRLINEYYRLVKELLPITIMLENVPALSNYTSFKKIVRQIKQLGYSINHREVDIAQYGVPQRRKRLVMVGSLLGALNIAPETKTNVTVREIIGNLESVETTNDPVHRIFPGHTDAIRRRIELTPHDGGSRNDLPEEYTLECHKKEGIGFRDVYGRLRWDDVSSTITGGCLNPSKGRFLHPEENRCISAREAAMLQTFRKNYIFPIDISRSAIALMIGNALPPEFCRQQAKNISNHLDVFFMSDIFETGKRSEIMSHVKNKGTEPELYIRKLLCELGYNRYRLKTSQLKCSPDIIFPRLKKAIFINGCFWHGHSCSRGALPKSNVNFWRNKIKKNVDRDKTNYEELQELKWDYLIIWQCEIKIKNRTNLEKRIIDFLTFTHT
ncbi:MAG TPA: DNA mismatch endonuclease Vsr [Selenomonadales bacterium]|nr:DNA mismatch endonuclease Vsr [Selenomonadales bacterium]